MREEAIVMIGWCVILIGVLCVAIWYLTRPNPVQKVLDQAITGVGGEGVVASIPPTRREPSRSLVYLDHMEFDFTNPEGVRSHRNVEFHSFQYANGTILLSAWDFDKSAQQLFDVVKLSNIKAERWPRT